ncbi:conserved hypothetical protein [[Clostridium] ultunense Esp]|nr:conserved hypothetical protein [[Clostridium] ultunense Esp]
MTKYGRGLNREIYLAVKSGEIVEPFGILEVKEFVNRKGWSVPDSYINVCLANAASKNHSPTYKKYFESIGEGKYIISSSV